MAFLTKIHRPPLNDNELMSGRALAYWPPKQQREAHNYKTKCIMAWAGDQDQETPLAQIWLHLPRPDGTLIDAGKTYLELADGPDVIHTPFPDPVEKLIGIARARKACPRPPGLKNRNQRKGHSDLSTEVEGLFGEQAVADMAGIKYNPSPKLEPDPGYDLVIGPELVQVKQTSWRNGDLLQNSPEHHKRCTYLVLVVRLGNFRGGPCHRMIGQITSERFGRIMQPVQLPGMGTRWGVGQQDLEPFSLKP